MMLILVASCIIFSYSKACTIESSVFSQDENIPEKYTCEGLNVSPPLSWNCSTPPEDVASFSLVVDDPDAPDPSDPEKPWVHWVVYNIPPEVSNIEEGADAATSGWEQGVNDFGDAAYGGPCPPTGRHRYFFTLTALDTVLEGLADDASKADIELAMEGHILEQSQLIGTYEKNNISQEAEEDPTVAAISESSNSLPNGGAVFMLVIVCVTIVAGTVFIFRGRYRTRPVSQRATPQTPSRIQTESELI